MEDENLDESTWIVLQEIRKAYLKANYSEYLEFDYHNLSKHYNLPEGDVRNILEMLINREVIKNRSTQWTVIQVYNDKFNELYAVYQSSFIKKELSFNYPVINSVEWQENFILVDKTFIFGNYGQVDLKSPDRINIFKLLFNAKGKWVKVQNMKEETGKDGNYIRSTLGQIKKQLKPELKKHLTIISTQEGDSTKKPLQGAYRLKFTSKP